MVTVKLNLGEMTSSQQSKDEGFPEIEFRECPRCHGYGVLDSGRNCQYCGGSGSGGLLNPDASIGSGEVMYDKKTGRRITHKELEGGSLNEDS